MHKRLLSGLNILLLLLLLSQPGRSRSVMAQTPSPTHAPVQTRPFPGPQGGQSWLQWFLILAAGGGGIGWLSTRKRSSTAVPPTAEPSPPIPPKPPAQVTKPAAPTTPPMSLEAITPDADATPPPTSYTAVTQLPAIVHPPLEEITPEPMPQPSDLASPTV
jgi:hypothetical protein